MGRWAVGGAVGIWWVVDGKWVVDREGMRRGGRELGREMEARVIVVWHYRMESRSCPLNLVRGVPTVTELRILRKTGRV